MITKREAKEINKEIIRLATSTFFSRTTLWKASQCMIRAKKPVREIIAALPLITHFAAFLNRDLLRVTISYCGIKELYDLLSRY